MSKYQTGELDLILNEFENFFNSNLFNQLGSLEREDKIEIELEDGRLAKQYIKNRYYADGNVNNMFIMFMQGHECGKLTERMGV